MPRGTKASPPCVRRACRRCGTLRGRIAHATLFSGTRPRCRTRQEWKYTGTRDSRLTHRSAFARSGVPEMRPRGRVAHYMDTFPDVTPFAAATGKLRRAGPTRKAQGARHDLSLDGRPTASCHNRDGSRSRRPRTPRPPDTRLRRPRYAARCVRIDRVANEDLGKCVVWPNRLRWQHVPACFSPRARSAGRDPVACEKTWLHEMERQHGFPRRHPS